MRKLHLIANAHIDPIWQWDWQEGAAVAVSTFQSAANLSSEFEYIFCHNEVTVFEYIEEYAPNLFQEMQRLVQEGKWHIMGGWYLQPDCNMSSGESLVRQIMVGRAYFTEKFQAKPTTAINFDPFGHSRGLVQILKKCGYDSYLFGRPFPSQCPIEDELFIWKGFDGSEVKAARAFPYRTPMGKAAEHISKVINENEDRDVWFALWGVGNHGGGPSRHDLTAIKDMQAASSFDIVHSTPESFFAEVAPSVVFDKSLQHCMPGCYTSMARLKQKHIQLENQLYMAEKICSLAAINGKLSYPESALKEAEHDLLNAEFHDVLPGTCIKSGEENGIRFLQHGLLICEKAFAKAFFTLTHWEEAAKEGEYPIFVFNPHPYPIKQVIDCEFTLADQNFEEATSLITVYDGDKALPTQMIREHSMLNCDWRKRVLFEAELPPMAMKRFSAFAEFVRQPARQAKDGGITVTEGDNSVTISEDGFLTSFKVNGKEYIDGKAFAPFAYDDNVDAWAMDDSQILGVGKNPKAILPTKERIGVFKNSTGVKVIEDGSVCTSVQACFATNNITLRTVYTIYKKGFYIDVKVMAVFNEADKFLKLHIPTTLKNADFQGQTVFGTETLDTDGREVVAQRFVSLTEQGEKEGLAILNNCLYGHSYKDGEVRLSLVRGAGYCVHPVDNQPFISETEYVDRLDQGETEFNFRIMVAKQDALEREAAIFNQKPFALNLFPTKNAEVKEAEKVIVSNDEIVMVAFKKKDKEDRFVIRLFNNSNKEKTSLIKVLSAEKELRFTKYEVKTLIYDNSNLLEIDEMVI